MSEKVSITVPGILKYIHFINDAGELLYAERVTFYSDELKQSFLQDMRIVMYELFSNAVQHSKSDPVTVDFELTDEWISLTFKTHGVSFGIKEVDLRNADTEREILYPPFPGLLYGKEFLVYSDPENQVRCAIADSYCLTFSHLKFPRRRFDVSELPEHYGLNLITKFSHEAVYSRDENGVDCFTVRRRIR